jgi:tetratricopeptide (TPR) repeat protein
LVIVNIQAYLFEKQSKIDTALELYLMGLKEAKFQKNELFEAVFYNNLSGIYSILGQLDQSIELSLKAAKIYKSLGLKMYYGSALLNIGNKYIKTEQYDLAQKYLIEAKVLSLEMNDFSALQNIELNLGIIEYEKKNYDLTLDHYQKGLAFAERLNDLDDYKASSVACMQENLGSIYKDLEQYDESIKIYQKAIAYGEKLNSIHILGRAYYDLFEIYQTLNKPDSAFYYIHKYLPINDRIQEETHNKRIEELNFQSKLEDEKTKYDQEKKLILANREKEKLKYVTIISLLGFISFAILFFWNVKRSKLIKSELKRQNLELEKEKLDLKLERTNRELSTSLLNLIERNEFVSEISSKLESIDAIQNEGDRRNIQSIIRDIDRNTSKKLWDELELSYIAVHKDFFDKLQSICPGLSSNERRLCSLIMLNLSTKDISSITYQSEHSIKIARYRLRKKLNLEKNSNLISFLSSI